MLFPSYEFLFLFLPLVLLGYYLLLPKSWRLGFLTVASYVFYGWWDFRFCSLLLISTVVDYIAGTHIASASSAGKRKGWLLVSLVTNLGLLGFFKYFDLFAETINALSALSGGGASPLPVLGIILPVGISFYTFQSMSYSIDIYMGAARPARTWIDFACYVSLFPQLIAGPIVRYRDLAEQLIERDHTIDKFARGIVFFVLGLSKKVLIADGVASLVPLAFESAAPDAGAAIVGVLAYTAQIYFDFSGYSDMAVGLGLMLGFQFPQNFDSPYKSKSITEFWRRWHISLSTWLRDYLYIPLGGNKKGPGRTYINLFLTMLLGGLWHGASWTFMLWGGYHGMLLAIERLFGKKNVLKKFPGWVQQAWTMLLVMFGWMLFRCESIEQVKRILRGILFNLSGGQIVQFWQEWSALPFIMLSGAVCIALFVSNTWEQKWTLGWRQGVVIAILYLLCVAVVLVNTSSPFLYFQF